jgi:hypothetical protein
MAHIPCGECVYLDLIDGAVLTVPGGINVEGKLLIPSSTHGTLRTPAVVVQGELEIDAPTTGHKFTLSLFGIDEVMFRAYGSDAVMMPVELGKKPIAVMGGKLNVQAMADDSCPSWVNLLDKSESSVSEPDEFFIGGDAEGSDTVQGISIVTTRSSNRVVTVGEEVDENSEINHFFRLDATQSGNNGGVRKRLTTGLTKNAAVGSTMEISYRYRVDVAADSTEEWVGRPYIRWGKWTRPKGKMWTPVCETASLGDWVTCKSEFVLTAAMNRQGYWWDLSLGWSGVGRTEGHNVDFDDLSITTKGSNVFRPDVLHVGQQAATCWEVGNDILITSSSNFRGEVVRTVIARDTTLGTLTLNERIDPAVNLLHARVDTDGADMAVEVASLSRRVVFTAERDDPNPLHGGHLIILHTPHVDQMLSGVEISNFGQQGVMGK